LVTPDINGGLAIFNYELSQIDGRLQRSCSICELKSSLNLRHACRYTSIYVYVYVLC